MQVKAQVASCVDCGITAETQMHVDRLLAKASAQLGIKAPIA